MRRTFLSIAALGAACIGCVSTPPKATVIPAAEPVSAVAGVSADDAVRIGREYVASGAELFLSPMIASVQDERSHWRLKVLQGYSGIHSSDLLIDKTTGQVRVERIQPQP